MRHAIVQAGTVINIALASPEYGAAQGWIASDTAGIGDTYAGGVFTRPVLAPVVPQTVSRRQAIQALFLADMLPLVQPAIDAIEDDVQRGLMQIEWDEALEFERTRPTLIALATAIGLSSDDLDQLFIQAGALP